MKKKQGEYVALLEKSKNYAHKQGFKLNPDKRIVRLVIEGLIENKRKYGEYYCPCRLEHTERTICPCYYHKKEIKQSGKCLCGLFVKNAKSR